MCSPIDMCASGTLAFWQTEAVKTTSRYAVNSLAVVKPYQRKKKDQRPGRISCWESAELISILVPFARKALWLWSSFYFLPGAMALRMKTHEHHRQHKNHVWINLRKQLSVSPYSPIVWNYPFGRYPIAMGPIAIPIFVSWWSHTYQKKTDPPYIVSASIKNVPRKFI